MILLVMMMQLLLQGVRQVKGMLILDPKCCVIKGHAVEEFEEHAEGLLEQGWRERLGSVGCLFLIRLSRSANGD